MAIELRVPSIGESITEVFIGEWRKQEGAHAASGENLVELESDKATLELPAPEAGVVAKILKKKGETAAVGEVIGYFEPAAAGAANGEGPKTDGAKPAVAEAPSAKPAAASVGGPGDGARVMPAAARELAERGLQATAVAPSGPGGRLLKEDVVRHAEAPRPAAPTAVATKPVPARPASLPIPVGLSGSATRQEEAVPMSPIRRRIAQRLVEAQQNAALLTTFNEVDMSGVMSLRSDHKDMFQQKHGIKLGFMSFFVKATIDALKMVPQVNAEIRGNDIIYHNYYDIGIAVSGGKGLVVPVLRNAERMSFAEVEGSIEHFGKLARDNKLTLEQLQGGTFTISNGGVFGSLLSTPIVNPPQSGILGLHAIQERPIAKDGQVIIRPMMYMAFTYDHRIIDGREAVTFLRRIKETIENPSRMLLEI
ncbi:MAG: 2-oxoglutarate dehydrogenase complex dihydrolipoyllysine-residue succinyltransferase [Planctomycetia bacterium]|nr:2-oxoglutarate dehydrogenase complex dihydrolipoyllysine-residue succinyltransferase [Planctomycetia bacterium]